VTTPTSRPAGSAHAASEDAYEHPFTLAFDICGTGLKANILKSADEMPVDGYSYKPEPDMRTFARILNHVSEAQFHTCSALNATPAASLPTVPPETAGSSSGAAVSFSMMEARVTICCRSLV